MRTQFIAMSEVDGIVSAQLECEWAAIVTATDGGYLAFESEDDYVRWNDQK